MVLRHGGKADVDGYLQSVVPQHEGHQRRKLQSVCLETLESAEEGMQAGPTYGVANGEMVPISAPDLSRNGWLCKYSTKEGAAWRQAVFQMQENTERYCWARKKAGKLYICSLSFI